MEQKKYYTLKEITTLLGEKPHTLRYWEQKFNYLKAKKTKSGSKLYTQMQLDKFRYVQSQLRQDALAKSPTSGQIKSDTATNNTDTIQNDTDTIKNDSVQNEKIIALYKKMTQANDIRPDEIIMLTKTEFKEMLAILSLLLQHYINSTD